MTDRTGDLVLVVGEINPDVVVADPDPVPVFGEHERLVGSIRLTVGSSSAIFACGAARLGLRVALFGVVGDDALGRFMLEALAARGVDTRPCVVDPSLETGASVILSGAGDRAILTALGAIGAMDVTAVPPELAAQAGHVHSGSYFLQAASREALPGFLASVRAAGATTSFDTNWDPDERWVGVESMLRAADLFFPNAAEARAITGRDDTTAAGVELARAGAAARNDGGPTVVVKLGPGGAIACRADGTVERTGALPVEAVDSTGAGDSFDAGYLRAWLAGAPTAGALRYAAACGALSTRRTGGVDGQPTAAEVDRALAGWPAR